MQVAFRVDGGAEIGMGHVMRCLTLARALHRLGADILFLAGPEAVAVLAQRFQEARLRTVPPNLSEPEDAVQTFSLLAREKRIDWLVVDQYRLGRGWERRMRGACRRILAIDDLGREHDCDLLLDTGFAAPDAYRTRVPQHCRLLLGPSYALLRDEFVAARVAASGTKPFPPRIFLCFGGSDPACMTLRAAHALAALPPEQAVVDVVAGGGYRDREALARFVAAQPSWRMFFDYPHPEELMAQATLAIGAGGTMTFERAAALLPSLVVSIADNQTELCRAGEAQGILRYLGSADTVGAETLLAAVTELLNDAPARAEMIRATQVLVDPFGTRRVVEALDSASAEPAPAYSLRPLTASDAPLLLDGRNREHVRRQMLAQQVIREDEHAEWMQARLAQLAHRPYFIFSHGDEPIGLVGLARREPGADLAVWGFYLWREDAPKGAGTHMLAAFLDRMFAVEGLQAIEACVNLGNAASLRLHRKLGFRDAASDYPDMQGFRLTAGEWLARRPAFMDILRNVAFR